jgi:hypothetical protein
MSQVHIRIGSSNFWIDSLLLNTHFPDVWNFNNGYYGNYLDLQILADDIDMQLPYRSRSSTKKVLKSVFGSLAARWNNNLDRAVGNRLHNDIADDTTFQIMRNGGLQRSRHAFATHAFLADKTTSTILAELLIDFLWDQRRTIVDCERPTKIDEWIASLDALRGLAPHHEINKCIDYLLRKYNTPIPIEYPRGRRFHRPEYYAPPPLRLRARTMPPVMQRPRYLQLPPPEPMLIGLPSPAHSMGHFDALRDAEMEELRVEQDVLAQKVDMLEWNQEAINEQIVGAQPVPMAAPRQIGFY